MITLEFEVPIYTFHIDYVGHVSNIVYIQWMEIGRTRLLEAAGLPLEQIASLGIAPVLVHTEIEYKQPLYLGDRVRVELWLAEMRHASVRIAFRFYKNGNVLVAAASQRGLFVHRATMQPYRMPRQMQAAFRPYLAGSE
jgi:acyl-CoA thioester hydrolase